MPLSSRQTGRVSFTSMNQGRRKLYDLPFPTFVVIGDVIPVLSGSRRVASFFYDDIVAGLDERALLGFFPAARLNPARYLADQRTRLRLLYQQAEAAISAGTLRKSRRELLDVQKVFADLPFIRLYDEILADMGIRATPFPFARAGQAMVIRVYLSKASIDVAGMIDSNLREAKLQSMGAFARSDGILHGYPECCAEAFAGRRETELRAALSYLASPSNLASQDREGVLATPADAFDMLGSAAYQFFSEEFFPCSLATGEQCAKATAVGENVFEGIKSALPEMVAQDFFLTNRNVVTDPEGRSSYTTSGLPDIASYKLPFTHFVEALEGW
jgi:hypothetical protein